MRPKLHDVYVSSFDVGGSAVTEDSFDFKKDGSTGATEPRSEDDTLRIVRRAAEDTEVVLGADRNDTSAGDPGPVMFESPVLDFQLTGDDSF